MADALDAARRAASYGLPFGSTGFNQALADPGQFATKSVQLGLNTPGVRVSPNSSGYRTTQFTSGAPINPLVDAQGRPTATAQLQQAADSLAADDSPEFEKIEVVKNQTISDQINEALSQLQTDRKSNRDAVDSFLGESRQLLDQNKADINRNATGAYDLTSLRQQLAEQNRIYEDAVQGLANRGGQYLARNIDSRLARGAGAGAPIADSSDLRQQVYQGFIDLNLPLQQQMAQRRSEQAMALQQLDAALAGRSQAERAALVGQLGSLLSTRGSITAQDLSNLGAVQAIEGTNMFRALETDMPDDFQGLPSSVPGRTDYPVNKPTVQNPDRSSERQSLSELLAALNRSGQQSLPNVAARQSSPTYFPTISQTAPVEQRLPFGGQVTPDESYKYFTGFDSGADPYGLGVNYPMRLPDIPTTGSYQSQPESLPLGFGSSQYTGDSRASVPDFNVTPVPNSLGMVDIPGMSGWQYPQPMPDLPQVPLANPGIQYDPIEVPGMAGYYYNP